MVIGLDFPPSEKYHFGYNQIKEYLPAISGFKKITILQADHNLGVIENCNRMYSYVREQGYECYIISEDDNEVAPCFLEYANWGLQYTKDNDSIYAVCGFKRVDTSFLKNNVYTYPRFNAWGYAQWFKRRDKVEKFRSLEVLKQFLDQMSFFDAFTSKVYQGASIIHMLKEGRVYGDVMPKFLPIDEQYCLFPTEPMAKNHGQDGSGIHGGTVKTKNLYDNLSLSENKRFEPHIEEPLYNHQLKKIYDSTYTTSLFCKIRYVFDFLLFKISGLGIYHKYGQPKYKFNVRKIRIE
ncbi:MAG: hypothetical protein J6P83_00515 [Bacteroidales bacterium]|nr:hypothetical protein [Bacteroidales bacterium]